ncbi:GNAT family N-acetyltransferase [Pandoraea sp.]|uniref:GNAT family N-acetyltransferase n=1 Tax=Pandoraea sp. TaxID=1883445 RepID=UPI00120ED593|nr:GNAT family N-acetyltransferase [Pandoraea sp.]TAL54370.1 MAG: GNAT family N-acetyltransferase [Pandoraea sp.]TAM17420.1 MAG: GNAT family N-acetyltransferase [Pandoraea sp.]
MSYLPDNRPHARFDPAGIRLLEECAFNAWPARQTIFCDGWLLRFNAGYTRRANSANAWCPTGSMAGIIGAAEAFYARHALPTVFRLSPLAGDEADAALAAAGYRQIDPTLVMTMPLAHETRSDDAVTLQLAPEAAWCAGFARANAIAPAVRATHDDMLAAIAMPKVFAALWQDGAPIAYGLAVAERGWVGLFDILVVPEARGRGAGRRITAALLDWGRRQGATHAYLQVIAANTPAVALYQRLGFHRAYGYHYRVKAT